MASSGTGSSSAAARGRSAAAGQGCLVELIQIFSFQLAGDDGDFEVQQVIEEQIMAGQGDNQLTTQEFEERFFEQS